MEQQILVAAVTLMLLQMPGGGVCLLSPGTTGAARWTATDLARPASKSAASRRRTKPSLYMQASVRRVSVSGRLPFCEEVSSVWRLPQSCICDSVVRVQHVHEACLDLTAILWTSSACNVTASRHVVLNTATNCSLLSVPLAPLTSAVLELWAAWLPVPADQLLLTSKCVLPVVLATTPWCTTTGP